MTVEQSTRAPAAVPTAEVVRRLRAVLGAGVDDSTRRRAEYSTDASNYRVVPAVVAFPRHVEEVLAAAQVCRETGTPLTMRGGGTSVAGNAVGTGVVLDLSRHLTRIHDIDPVARRAIVEPGVILADLQRAAAPHGLRFGPDPSTHARATLGGMIGNNACGPHAVAYGRTADNVEALDVVDGLGRRFTAGRGAGPVEGLDELVRRHLALLRTELGRFGRQVSGYSLEHLLPENGTHLAKALVGTEGTCAVLLGATVRLVEVAPAHALAVLGYPDMATAADDVPALLAHAPLAVEGIDARLVDVVRHHTLALPGESHVPELPPGGGWLMVEVGGATPEEALAAAEALCRDASTRAVRVLPAGPEATSLWRIREDGAGLAGRTASGAQAWPGWEDAAVPPERLGDYLRGFGELMRAHGVDGLAYGHFGDGCVHVRIDLPLADAPQRLRPFLTEAAHLVASHGGSLSGEHGDGRARSELLPIMYSAEALSAFAEFKDLFDPHELLNPGLVVRPRPVDADLRRPVALPLPRVGGFALRHDDGDLTKAVHRCVGVGKCRADTSSAGGFMCPSYLATRDEKDSTRGRSRVLQELANGSLVRGWDAPEVEESLDLCLSCKACASDCPAGVDMATYKSEVLHRRYAGRLRPVAHYALGWLPLWARLAGPVAPVVNAVMRVGPLRRALLRAGGMDARRGVPRFATTPFRRLAAMRPEPAADARPPVLLWVDSFTGAFSPEVAVDAVRVLEAAGYRVLLPAESPCCGLTWISTGQLDGARRRLRGSLDVLGPYAAAGTPIVGLEPSCTSVLRTDLLELLPDDPRSAQVAGAVHTLAELLTGARGRPAPSWTPPSLDGVDVLAQPHCHQHATMGYDADRTVLAASGAQTRTIAGCCGLAGNFGMEAGHYEVSVAVAENGLLPALRDGAEGEVFLADGFSCRTQADQLAGRQGVHLAQLLARALDP